MSAAAERRCHQRRREPTLPPSNTPDQGSGVIQPLDLRLKAMWWDAHMLRGNIERGSPRPGTAEHVHQLLDLESELGKLGRAIDAFRAAGAL